MADAESYCDADDHDTGAEEDAAANTPCSNCGEAGLQFYEESVGGMVCECGLVLEHSSLRLEVERVATKSGGVEKVGTFVSATDDRRFLLSKSAHNTTRGAQSAIGAYTSAAAAAAGATVSVHAAKAKRYAMQRLSQIASTLQLSTSHRTQVRTMADNYLRGRYGQGRWIELVLAACVYVICRTNHTPLTLTDVADAIQCNVYKVGRAFMRLTEELGIRLDTVDPVLFIDRLCVPLTTSTPPAPSDLLMRIKAQATKLIRLAKHDSLVTGRGPAAVTAAAVHLAAQANHVTYDVNAAAEAMHVAPRTVHLRETELLASLHALSESLPWGGPGAAAAAALPSPSKRARSTSLAAAAAAAAAAAFGTATPRTKSALNRDIRQHLPFLIENLDKLLELDSLLRAPKPLCCAETPALPDAKHSGASVPAIAPPTPARPLLAQGASCASPTAVSPGSTGSTGSSAAVGVQLLACASPRTPVGVVSRPATPMPPTPTSTASSNALAALPFSTTDYLRLHPSDPPSYRRAVEQRRARLLRIKVLARRMAARSGSGSVTLNLDGIDLSVIPDVGDDSPAAAARDDADIEKLLLRGVSVRVIADGDLRMPPDALQAQVSFALGQSQNLLSPELTDADLGGDDPALYVRSQQEVAAVESVASRVDRDRRRPDAPVWRWAVPKFKPPVPAAAAAAAGAGAGAGAGSGGSSSATPSAALVTATTAQLEAAVTAAATAIAAGRSSSVGVSTPVPPEQQSPRAFGSPLPTKQLLSGADTDSDAGIEDDTAFASVQPPGAVTRRVATAAAVGSAAAVAAAAAAKRGSVAVPASVLAAAASPVSSSAVPSAPASPARPASPLPRPPRPAVTGRKRSFAPNLLVKTAPKRQRS